MCGWLAGHKTKLNELNLIVIQNEVSIMKLLLDTKHLNSSSLNHVFILMLTFFYKHCLVFNFQSPTPAGDVRVKQVATHFIHSAEQKKKFH